MDVEKLKWKDVKDYIDKLNSKLRIIGSGYIIIPWSFETKSYGNNMSNTLNIVEPVKVINAIGRGYEGIEQITIPKTTNNGQCVF